MSKATAAVLQTPDLSGDLTKTDAFQAAATMLAQHHLRISRLDITRPWGFFIAIDETQAQDFAKLFFPALDLKAFSEGLALQPKLLGFAPKQRLSWQYHHRRGEIWRNIAGEFQIVSSHDNTERQTKLVKPGEVVEFPQGTRHRGIGLETWGLAAEIWKHLDDQHPSDEDDIVRVQDDYRRS